jgi:Glycosyl hydrolase family 81 C-terminal domain
MAPRQSYGTLPSADSDEGADFAPLNGIPNGRNGSSSNGSSDKKKKDGEKQKNCSSVTDMFGCWGFGGQVVAAVVVAGIAVAVCFGVYHFFLAAPPGASSSSSSSLRSMSTGLAISPVADLGLISVVRDLDGLKPGRAWGEYRRSGSNSSISSVRTAEAGGEEADGPSSSRGRGRPLPTNVWYLNLLSDLAGTKYNTEASRVYTVPYILDTVGSIPGVRVHWPTIQASDRNIQMVVDVENGLTLGGAAGTVRPEYTLASAASSDGDDVLSPLGLSLEWGGSSSGASGSGSGSSMVAHIVRGMPMATMEYRGKGIVPTIVAGKVPAGDPWIDGTNSTTLKCGPLEVDDAGNLLPPKTLSARPIQREVLLHFKGSDFTWIVFFSRPVTVSCSAAPDPESVQGTTPGAGGLGTMFQLQVVTSASSGEDGVDEEPLVVRTALVDECTTGRAAIMAHCEAGRRMKDPEGYLEMLRKSAHVYPRGRPRVDLHFSDTAQNVSRITFDWDVASWKSTGASSSTDPDDDGSSAEIEPLMYALPFQQEMLESVDSVSSNRVLKDFCKPTFHGSTCLVKGSKWSLVEKVEPKPSFYGARPPEASAIPALAEALSSDLRYRLSSNLKRGAADTYFSGKILARLGRVLMIATELLELASDDNDHGRTACTTLYDEAGVDLERCALSVEAAKKAQLPTRSDINAALDDLREGVEVWISGLAEARYVYDSTWGGLVNCGCNYTVPEGVKADHGFCSNEFPNCPALVNVNEDFGNGFYNDHHYHYGYHVGAAAVVAKLDPEWGLEWFDRVMLYVRDIANPNADDDFFPQFRQKDWYLGSSWASGLASFNEMHGRNQESSSEAIAAYENVALFGTAIVDAIADLSSRLNVPDALQASAKQVLQVGSLLTATELHATQRYWHVWNSTKHVNTYPPEYTKPVVGMLYETMASFQTWFSGGDMASIGIQLLPFTPVSEARDDPDWAADVYPAYYASCESEKKFCVNDGWSVMLSGLEATIGQREKAMKDALAVPDSVFSSDGGCGHSRSNMLWYIATRPDVKTPKRE